MSETYLLNREEAEDDDNDKDLNESRIIYNNKTDQRTVKQCKNKKTLFKLFNVLL